MNYLAYCSPEMVNNINNVNRRGREREGRTAGEPAINYQAHFKSNKATESFAYGVILCELMTLLSPPDIAKQAVLKSRNTIKPQQQPLLIAPDELLSLTRLCLDSSPSNRPVFSDIVEFLRRSEDSCTLFLDSSKKGKGKAASSGLEDQFSKTIKSLRSAHMNEEDDDGEGCGGGTSHDNDEREGVPQRIKKWNPLNKAKSSSSHKNIKSRRNSEDSEHHLIQARDSENNNDPFDSRFDAIVDWIYERRYPLSKFIFVAFMILIGVAVGIHSSGSGSDSGDGGDNKGNNGSPSNGDAKLQSAILSSSAPASNISSSTTSTTTTAWPRIWGGVNSFFMHALQQSDQDEIISNLQAAGIKVVRIFITATGTNSKNSASLNAPDVEALGKPAGTYDDTILYMIDSLMLRMKRANMKLIIELHDRYALGCWGYDVYVDLYGLPVSKDCGSSTNNPSAFYTNSAAIAQFDERIKHILSHRNQLLGNRTWSTLDDVIQSIGIENESQGHMPMANQEWLCGRAKVVNTILSQSINATTNGSVRIPVSSGGGTDFTSSLLESNFQCKYLDIISLHSYSTSPTEFTNNIKRGLYLAEKYAKTVVMEEFGLAGSRIAKATFFKSIISICNKLGVSWLPWEVMKPGNPNDFEFYKGVDGEVGGGIKTSDDEVWSTLTILAHNALLVNDTATVSMDEFHATTSSTGLGEWEFCSTNDQCAR